MLSDRTDLRNSSVSCTLKSYLFASLRCINDISLMNFPILPRGDLYMLQCRVSLPFGLCCSKGPLDFSLFQSCCIRPLNIRWRTPVSFGTAKVGNFFKPANFFLFFSKLFSLLLKTSAVSFPSFQISSPPASLSPSVVTSVAGCKGRKLFRFPKLFLKFFSAFP